MPRSESDEEHNRNQQANGLQDVMFDRSDTKDLRKCCHLDLRTPDKTSVSRGDPGVRRFVHGANTDYENKNSAIAASVNFTLYPAAAGGM